MISELVLDTKLFYLLYLLDLDLARNYQQLNCPYCGSVLHFARYIRKPRGGPKNIPDEYMIRHSLCCSGGDCRRRTLPASCLFMGRRVYWACVILVVMALRQQRAKGASIYRLKRIFGIDHKTICRWIQYFRQVFPATAQWRSLRGLVGPQVDECRLPGSLFVYFSKQVANQQEALAACLRFLSTGDVQSV